MTVDEIQERIENGKTVLFANSDKSRAFVVKPLGFTIDESGNVMIKGEEIKMGTISYWAIEEVLNPDDYNVS